MVWWHFLTALACLLGVEFSGLAAEPDWLAYGDLRGYLQTCGCDPRTDLGGVARLATLVSRERAAQPKLLLLDLGNNYPMNEQGASLVKGEALTRALALIKPDAALLNRAEWPLREQIGSTRPFVLSNLATAAATPPVQQLIELPAARVLGYLWDESLRSQLVPWGDELRRRWQKLLGPSRPAGDARARVLLFAGPFEQLAAIAGSGLFELIVSSNTASDDERPGFEEREDSGLLTRLSSPLFVRMVPLGGVGVLRGGSLRKAEAPSLGALLADAQQSPSGGGRSGLLPAPRPVLGGDPRGLVPALPNVPVTWLARSYEDGSPLGELLAEYEKSVAGEFNSQLAERLKNLAATPYVGAEACRSCHAEAFKVWEGSSHARAYKTLQVKGKHEDAECVACHVLGFDKPGGFVSLARTPEFAGVQCETCHGPRKEHSQSPQRRPEASPPPQEGCPSCHHTPHSAAFDFSKYWPKIKHGR